MGVGAEESTWLFAARLVKLEVKVEPEDVIVKGVQRVQYKR